MISLEVESDSYFLHQFSMSLAIILKYLTNGNMHRYHVVNSFSRIMWGM